MLSRSLRRQQRALFPHFFLLHEGFFFFWSLLVCIYSRGKKSLIFSGFCMDSVVICWLKCFLTFYFYSKYLCPVRVPEHSLGDTDLNSEISHTGPWNSTNIHLSDLNPWEEQIDMYLKDTVRKRTRWHQPYGTVRIAPSWAADNRYRAREQRNISLYNSRLLQCSPLPFPPSPPFW